MTADAHGTGRGARARQRYAGARQRIDASSVGELQRRIQDLEVMNKALLLSALALTLFIPALITISAALPLGSDHGLAADWSRRLGLSAAATHDMRQLFTAQRTVRTDTTVISSLATVVFALGWPAELARGYGIIWHLPPLGWRASWRFLAWLIGFFLAIGAVASVGAVAGGFVGTLVTGVVGLPLAVLWSWWSLHLLLGGRVGWRSLFPGAVATAVGLLGLRLVMTVYLSRAIESNYEQYGVIGALFAMFTWIVGFCVVMLGGPLAGHTYLQRRHERKTPPAQLPTATPWGTGADADRAGAQ